MKPTARTEEYALALLRLYEGLRLKVYVDTTGNRTVGHGHKLRSPSHGHPGENMKEVTKEQAEWMLRLDHMNACLGVVRILFLINQDGMARAMLNSMLARTRTSRQIALGDLVFNLGEKGVRGFRRMLAAVGRRDWDAAADELEWRNPSDPGDTRKTKYWEQVGKRAQDNAHRLRTDTEPEGVS